MRRAVELGSALLALSLAAATSARAEEPSTVSAGTPPAAAPTLRLEAAPASEGTPSLRLEVGGGFGSPLGSGFIDAVYTPNRWLSVGAGGGFIQPDPGIATIVPKKVRRYGAFARGHLLRWRGLALGPVLTFSSGDLAHDAHYMRPGYAPDLVATSWRPGYRLDGGVGVELRGRHLSARLEAGVGYVLNEPTCSYLNQLTVFQGSCDSPELPAYYHFSVEPGRVTPYLSLAVGAASFASDEPTAPGEAPAAGAGVERARAEDPRVDDAWAAPTALTQPKGRVAVTLYELFLPAVTVGVTDRLQVTAGLGWFYFTGSGAIAWDASIKLALANLSHLHVALFAGTVGVARDRNLYGVGAGPVVSLCIDEGCESVVSASVLGGNVHSYGWTEESSPHDQAGVLVSPSAVLSLVRHVKLVAEVHVPVGESKVLWVAGLRVPFGPVAVDGGVLQGKVPVGSITWRW
jgi:hypothetical protein